MSVPTDFTGLVAWYKYNTGLTVSGGLVSRWRDSSGNGNDLVQATATNQPQHAPDGGILFDGADNYLKTASFTLVQPETVYMLFNLVSATTNDRIFDGNTFLSMLLNTTDGATNTLALFAGTGNDPGTTATGTGQYVALAAVFNGASSVIQVNSTTTSTGNPGASNGGGFTLGTSGDGTSGGWANIQVKEVIIYNVAHAIATRTPLIEYMTNIGSSIIPRFRAIGRH